jgi:putative tryptophan/tyrosine transport system substrate-binding protein
VDRRAVVAGIVGLLAGASTVKAQPTGKVFKIGFVGGGSQAPAQAVLEGLRDLGYVEGQNLVFERRFAEGKLDRLPELVIELIRLHVELIVVVGTPAARAARTATATIPIVFSLSDDPVTNGLVRSLARPGGNLTGWTSGTFEDKQLELLKEAIPGLSRVGYLWDANYGPTPAVPAATVLGLQVQFLRVRGPGDFDRAFTDATTRRAGALVVMDSPMLGSHDERIAELATKRRLPSIGCNRTLPASGGLMSYGPKVGQNWPRVALQVDKILKGAKPADLPVERPTTFELVINLKTAKALGLTIPPAVLGRADEVIQ